MTLMNPPFGDSSLASKPYIEHTYLDTRGDIYKAFVERFQARLVPAGYLGIISSRTGFFLAQSEDWRTRVVLRLFRPIVLADLGSGVLDAMVEVAAYVLRNLSESEARDVTLSLLPVLRTLELDAQDRFSIVKWQAARNGVKRHQAASELEHLEGAGYVKRCDGELVRYTPLWRAIEMASSSFVPSPPPLVCIRALGEADKAAVLTMAIESGADMFRCDPREFSAIPGSPFTYWVGSAPRRLFRALRPLESEGRDVQSGASTMDDFRFLRTNWEVNPGSQARSRAETTSGKRWVPLAKGGVFSRYHIDWELLIDWRNDGLELKTHVATYRGDKGWGYSWTAAINGHNAYFRPGLTWPRRTTSGLGFRVLPAGGIFGDKSPVVFAPEDDRHQLLLLLAILNSRAFEGLVSLQLSTSDSAARSYEVGLMEQTPIPSIDDASADRLSGYSLELWRDKYSLDSVDDTSHAFDVPALAISSGATLVERGAAWTRRLRTSDDTSDRIQTEINRTTLHLYGLDEADSLALTRTLSAESSDDDGKGGNEEKEAAPAGIVGLTEKLATYVVGAAYGRWDVRNATGEKPSPELPDPFSPLPVCPPGMLQNAEGLPLTQSEADRLRAAGTWNYPIDLPWDGILVGDPENANDLVARVREVLGVIWKDRAQAIEQEASEILEVKDLREYFHKPTLFFADHLKCYSKSRRQAPIYWPLSTASGSYTLWVYYHRLNDDTLFGAVNQYVKPKIRDTERRVRDLESDSAKALGREASKSREALEAANTLLSELSEMGYLPDSGGYYMLWFRTADKRFVRDWCHRDRLLDKAVEEFATTSGRPPVEPECEFIQVIVEMFATHRSLVSAEEPAFQQRRHTMNSWHQLRGRFLLASEKGHPVSISPGFHWIVSKPAIRVNGTTRLDSLLHKGEQTLCRRVGYAAHPNASNTRAILFRSNDNQGLGFRLSPASALFRTSNIGLVHLDCAREPIASRTHHRPPQFVQPRPSCLVTSQS